jgi:hypothetical protein
MNVVSIASGVKKAIEWSIHMTWAVPMMSIMWNEIEIINMLHYYWTRYEDELIAEWTLLVLRAKPPPRNQLKATMTSDGDDYNATIKYDNQSPSELGTNPNQ